MPPSNTNTEIALMKKDIEYIKQSMLEQKEQHKALYDMLKDFIDSSPEKFVTRPEHENNAKRISELEADKKAIIRWIVVSFIWIILVLTWLSKYFL